MSVSSFDHPYLSGLLGDDETSAILGADNQLKLMLQVEACFSNAVGASGAVSKELAQAASAAILNTKIDVAALKRDLALDGVAVPSLVRQIKAQCDHSLHCAIHNGMTSQDVIDNASVLAFKQLMPIYRSRLADLILTLEAVSAKCANAKLMGRTRMQAAKEISVSDRINAWLYPLRTLLPRLDDVAASLLRLQLGGPVGNRGELGKIANEIAAAMSSELGLADTGHAWHSDRTAIVDFANWLSMVTGALGKFGQDVALMAQQGIDEITLSGGGGSSAMPHKKNPILAETLVSLAHYNAAQISAMHQTLVHEQERSGAAWTLEWMILPQMCQATGVALSRAQDLAKKIEMIGNN